MVQITDEIKAVGGVTPNTGWASFESTRKKQSAKRQSSKSGNRAEKTKPGGRIGDPSKEREREKKGRKR